MQYEIDSANMTVVMEGAEINAIVGENARIEISEALNYIKTGQAEITEEAARQKAAFNVNATEKTAAYDRNADNRLSEYNSNADNKLEAYNNNDLAKVSAYNQNAVDKTTTFNQNATAKQALVDAGVQTATDKAAEAKQWAEQAESSLSGLSSRVTTIEDKIPSTASSDNQLIDKDYVDTADNILQTAINGKQDTISDLSTIRSGASAGATAVQPGSLSTVATTGAYSDLIGTPTIPVVNNAVLTITQNGTSVGTFTANASSNITIATTDTTYSNFTGSDGTSAGNAGLVPAPSATDNCNFLKGDGTWDLPTAQTSFANITGQPSDNTNLANALSDKASKDLSNITLTAQENLVDLLFPIGSCYIGTGSTCPLAAIKGTWTLQSSGVITSVDTNVPVKGNGKTLGLTDGTNYLSPTLNNVVYHTGSPYISEVYDKNIGTSVTNWTPLGNDKALGVTTDASKSGVVGTVTSSTLSVNIWQRTA